MRKMTCWCPSMNDKCLIEVDNMHCRYLLDKIYKIQ